MKAVTKITFYDEQDEKFFGEGSSAWVKSALLSIAAPSCRPTSL